MHVGRAVGGVNPMGGGYDLDEFGDENVIQESRDFAEAVRSKIASEHKQTSSVSGFEVKSLAPSLPSSLPPSFLSHSPSLSPSCFPPSLSLSPCIFTHPSLYRKLERAYQ